MWTCIILIQSERLNIIMCGGEFQTRNLTFWACSLETIQRCADAKFFSSIDPLLFFMFMIHIVYVITSKITFLFNIDVDILMIITNASRAFDGEPCRPHLPYATFTEVIWGEQRVQEIWKRYRGCFFPRFLWVGFSCRFIAVIICAHASFLMRLYAQQHRMNGHFDRTWGEEIYKEDKKAKRTGGPDTGWGSSLCCWLGCHITPCGDDCAIYCLAGAGELRRSQTGSAVCKQNKLNGEELAFIISITLVKLRKVKLGHMLTHANLNEVVWFWNKWLIVSCGCALLVLSIF